MLTITVKEVMTMKVRVFGLFAGLVGLAVAGSAIIFKH